MSPYSQYTSLWSVSNSPLTPMSQNGGTNNSLSSQFLRGSGSHYPGLSPSVAVPSSGSPMYDSGPATEVHEYDTSPHGRLPSAWTPVTPPSLWWMRFCKRGERRPWNVARGTLNLLQLKGRINWKLNLHNPGRSNQDFEFLNALTMCFGFSAFLRNSVFSTKKQTKKNVTFIVIFGRFFPANVLCSREHVFSFSFSFCEPKFIINMLILSNTYR